MTAKELKDLLDNYNDDAEVYYQTWKIFDEEKRRRV